MERNKVVLVNTEDEALEEMDKMEAHVQGILHRAFSVFIFNQKGDMLIHQRATNKYHGADLWTNACCSHPQWGEDVRQSALDRLEYEMGLKCDIKKAFSFLYKTSVENNLTEHEFDHVFVGYTDENPNPNPEEVQNYQWISPEKLQEQIKAQPQLFTYWFRMALPKVLEEISRKNTAAE